MECFATSTLDCISTYSWRPGPEHSFWNLLRGHCPKSLLLFAVSVLHLHGTASVLVSTVAGLFCIGTLHLAQKHYTRMCCYIPDTMWEPSLPQTLTLVPKECASSSYECQPTMMPLLIPLHTTAFSLHCVLFSLLLR